MTDARGGIEEISIKDLGVIADASLPLGAGFTAITGETGAGKTMVVSALGLLLGERADTGAVRLGSPQAWVEGRWRVPSSGEVVARVRDAGGDVDPIDTAEAELVLSRSVSAEGRSRAVVGGRSAPVSVLTELGEQLVVVHGQSDQIRLRSAIAQRAALDRFAGPQFAEQLATYEQVFHRWRDNRAELDELIADQDRRAREAEDLRVAMAEIESVAPQPGEDDELAERAERLTNLEDLRLAAGAARELLSAEESEGTDALGLLDNARRQLERVAPHDSALQPLAESVAEANYLISDIAAQLSTYLAALDADGANELEVVQERRSELAILIRKYGPTLDDVIRTLETGSLRLLELDGDADRIGELTQEVEADAALVAELAAGLSAERTAAAARLSEAVTEELSALAMPDARIVVEVTQRDDADPQAYTASGRDQVAILLQPHPGAEPRPLGKGASGGELSRVMLAIEVVIAGSDPVPTFIFDEVDAGVGGASAIEIGRRLARLAETAQVIVVTHLAQVAAFATNHLTVVKGSDGAVTESSVRRLDGDERIAEMARLLSGLPDSESGLAHARELVDMASAARR
ncbi:DNA replication and repair protein RecN [Leifsonia sp. 98AMF]|uniref:DNA repair protein RecN n=1 Tax=unclassified Leifsonia TaxID=2663824 RepID=UPI0003667DB8|nr:MULTISPECIES: DNA repair protein RecN [unclassified Leifsonia]TDQ02989.1 DNA replication and repair protein RecN [Leifsonia sp. 115AMFTsu3.1]SDH21313.1 DNA replication and repair protein RecN [Leifsonia sp. 197AMF]SDJ17328.1 DNA replication and repair protein RecN [Leifsonia sp. 466MF]SDJ49894.1 DNA replication and repair protein RecN [Leifsonia sp. 157MF]SDN38689.1 DNA replication and repair protein RecN [Leifsonia sp. 509MF]